MSGSQSPFSMQVAEVDPISTNPGGQLKVIVLPSTGIMLPYPTTCGTESALHDIIHVGSNSGCPQLAKYKCYKFVHVAIKIIVRFIMNTSP